jgi:hypothetical protein
VKARFVHVGFNTSGEIPIARLEKLFSTSVDWIRYGSHCWILYTRVELDTWRDRIRATPGVKDGFLLLEVDVTARSGYLPKSAWDWLQKDRPEEF